MIATKYDNAVLQDGVALVRSPGGFGVKFERYLHTDQVLRVTAEYYGRKLAEYLVPCNSPPMRDYLGKSIDHLKIVLRAYLGEELVAELTVPEHELLLSFMVRQGEQQHITENYVSVPPALTITDEVGAVWTLGFKTAPKDLSPEGEFAFNVLRDGIDTGEIASRIERRNSKIRIFTRHGWKRWLGRNF